MHMTEFKSSDEYYRDLLELKSQEKLIGPVGIYRFHPNEFKYIGYTLPVIFHKWTGKYGIRSLEDFKKSQLVQEIAFRESLAQIWEDLKDYQHYEGQNIKGIKITKSGILTAGFYIGRKHLKEFLRTSGEYDIQDKNQIRCSDYIQKFAGYDIDYSITDLVQQRREEINSSPEDKIQTIILSLENRYDELLPETKQELIMALKIGLFEKFAILMSKYTISSSQKAHGDLTGLANSLNITPEIVGQIIDQGHAEIERVFKRKLLKFAESVYTKELAINVTSEDKLQNETLEIAKKLDLREMLGYVQQYFNNERIADKLKRLIQKIKFKEVPDDLQKFIKKEDIHIAHRLKYVVLRSELTSDLKKVMVENIMHEVVQTRSNLENCREILITGYVNINSYNPYQEQRFESLVGKIEGDLEKWKESVGVMESEQDDLSLTGEFYKIC